MILNDPRWESVSALQRQLSKKSNSPAKEAFLNAACDAVLDLIESGCDGLSLDEIRQHYTKAGLNAVRKSYRRKRIEERNSSDLRQLYYGSYIDADTITARQETKQELLSKFSGENKKILKLLLEGYSQKEIANDCELPYDTVRKRLSRIRIGNLA